MFIETYLKAKLWFCAFILLTIQTLLLEKYYKINANDYVLILCMNWKTAYKFLKFIDLYIFLKAVKELIDSHTYFDPGFPGKIKKNSFF